MPQNNTKKHIYVTCAIIERNGLVFAAQRNANMKLPLKWEFPGGKIMDGENPEGCLLREISEELGVEIFIDRPLPRASHEYQTFTISLYPFVCAIVTGEIILHEHADAIWLPPEKLPELDWSEADIPVIASFRLQLEKRGP